MALESLFSEYCASAQSHFSLYTQLFIVILGSGQVRPGSNSQHDNYYDADNPLSSLLVSTTKRNI